MGFLIKNKTPIPKRVDNFGYYYTLLKEKKPIDINDEPSKTATSLNKTLKNACHFTLKQLLTGRPLRVMIDSTVRRAVYALRNENNPEQKYPAKREPINQERVVKKYQNCSTQDASFFK